MAQNHCYSILLESATDSCSVALADGEGIVDERYFHIPKIHDKIMAQQVADLLQQNGIKAEECCAVAISGGPGSYMGLRIASSLAKGLAYGAGINLIAVSTLDVIAQCAVDNNLVEDGVKRIVAMIDAGRMEVYCASYNLDMERITPIEAKILDTESFADELQKEKILFTGNGIKKFEQLLSDAASENEKIRSMLANASFQEQLPHATGLRRAAYKAIKNSQYESVAYYEPFYLKEFIPGKPKKLL